MIKYKRPDANQLEIEQYLQQLGFWTYRTANDNPQRNSNDREFHPLDLLVLGINRRTDRVELTLWEIKTDENASFTDKEELFIQEIDRFFDRVTPVAVATSLNNILDWYGWVDN
jgi:hypothetical protein